MSIYRRDISKVNKAENKQISFDMADEYDERLDLENKTDFKNELVTLSYEQLLRNIHQLQIENNIKLSPALVKNFGRCGLDIETETGTGKTYVYIKTMFNLKLLIHSDQ